MALTETQILRTIKETARSLSFAFYHTKSSFASDKGFPDIVIAGPVDSPAPSVMFYETKGVRGKPTFEQEMWITTLTNAGQVARFVYEADLPSVYTDIEAAYRKHLEAMDRG